MEKSKTGNQIVGAERKRKGKKYFSTVFLFPLQFAFSIIFHEQIRQDAFDFIH